MRTPSKLRPMGRMNFEKLIDQGGISAREFTAQTANGTAHAIGTGWNKEWWWPEDGLNSQVQPEGPWAPGRSNRTGE